MEIFINFHLCETGSLLSVYTGLTVGNLHREKIDFLYLKMVKSLKNH